MGVNQAPEDGGRLVEADSIALVSKDSCVPRVIKQVAQCCPRCSDDVWKCLVEIFKVGMKEV